MSINALNGFFSAVGGGDKLGSRLSDAYTEMRLGSAMGNARRAAAEHGLALDNQLIEQDTGEVELVKPDAVYDQATARRFRQEEGPTAKVEQAKKETKRQADLHGDSNVEALYLTKFLPQQVKKLRDGGNTVAADRLEGYVTTETGQQHGKLYANMVKAHASMNFAGAAKFMEQLQELSGEDTNATVMADGKGGYKVRLQNTASGSVEEYELDESRLMGKMGMFAYMDPANMGAKMVERYDKQAKVKADNMVAVAKEKEQTWRQMSLQGLKYDQNVQLQGLKFKQDVQLKELDLSKPTDKEREYNWLERIGQPRAVLDQYVAGIVGGAEGGYGKATHPETVAQMMWRQYEAAPNSAVGKRQRTDKSGKSVNDRKGKPIMDDVTWAELSAKEKQDHIASQMKGMRGAANSITESGSSQAPAAPPRSLPPMLR